MRAFADMGPAGNRIKRAFDLMEIAERTIKTLSVPRDVFKHCCPNTEMLEMHDAVYSFHVQELCVRAARKESMTQATDAEVLCMLLTLSLKAPLNSRAGQAAERIFERIYGTARMKELFGASYQKERDPESVDRFIAEARHALRTGR